MTRDLIRRVIHYPRVMLPSDDSDHVPNLVRRIDVRPGRFIVNNPDTKNPDWYIPREFLREPQIVAPLNAALHLGRVEDIEESSDTIEVIVWEVPNGREGTTTLTRDDVGEKILEVGDTIRMYTWVEIPLGSGSKLRMIPKIGIEVTPRTPLSEEERGMLAALISEMHPLEPKR